VLFGWSTSDFSNVGITNSASTFIAQPLSIDANACATVKPVPDPSNAGAFIVTSTAAVPAANQGGTGSLQVAVQGYVAHDFGAANTQWFSDGVTLRRVTVPNVVKSAAISGQAVDRRTVVDVQKCDVCHKQLSLHGGNRTDNILVCAMCHNPNATDSVGRLSQGITWGNAATTASDGLGEQTIDLKVFIHALHAAPDLVEFLGSAYTPFAFYGYSTTPGEAPTTFVDMTPFPTAVGGGGGPTINHCTGCHAGTTYYPPDPSSSVQATTTQTTDNSGTALATPLATTAGAAVCSSCHVTSSAKAHMSQNGASFTAPKNPITGALVSPSQESCLVCHGPGSVEDVAVVHLLSSFP
jgi:OmcA/MtrC family decaheme c-type cytochrome